MIWITLKASLPDNAIPFFPPIQAWVEAMKVLKVRLNMFNDIVKITIFEVEDNGASNGGTLSPTQHYLAPEGRISGATSPVGGSRPSSLVGGSHPSSPESGYLHRSSPTGLGHMPYQRVLPDPAQAGGEPPAHVGNPDVATDGSAPSAPVLGPEAPTVEANDPASHNGDDGGDDKDDDAHLAGSGGGASGRGSSGGGAYLRGRHRRYKPTPIQVRWQGLRSDIAG